MKQDVAFAGAPRYPVILVHGIARFDHLVQRARVALDPETLTRSSLWDALHYFRLIASHLRSRGVRVLHADLGFAESMVDRGLKLRSEIDRILHHFAAPSAHVIAHSMGGLDARQAITAIPGTDQLVRSLTTIGTPHLGTPLADWVLARGGEALIRRLASFLDLRGYRDLSLQSRASWNHAMEPREAANAVAYQTVSSWQEVPRMFLPFRLPSRIVGAREGLNDGVVSKTSQSWTLVLKGGAGRNKNVRQMEVPFRADHYNQVGWWHPEQVAIAPASVQHVWQQRESYESAVRGFYASIASGLREYE